MSYQEVYNGLNKKASNEQIKKLASIIGMRKKESLKKEAAVKKLAGLLKMKRKAAEYNTRPPKLSPSDAMAWFARPVGKIKHLADREQLSVTPPKGETISDEPVILPREAVQKAVPELIKNVAASPKAKEYFSLNPKNWVRSNKWFWQ